MLHADFAARRASGERLLKLDPLDLRHQVPHRWYVWAYEHVLPVVYRFLGATAPASAPGSTSRISSSRRRAHRHAGALRRRPPAAAPVLRSRRRVRCKTMRHGYEQRLGDGPDATTRSRTSSSWCAASAAAVPDAHMLVVDDGSADGTAEKAEALGAEIGGVEVLRRPRKMGLGSAYRAGHAIGIARGYDVMVQIDADLSHDPAALPDPARRDRTRRRPRDRLALRPGRFGPQLAEAPAALSVWGNRYAGCGARAPGP